jgi:hypothetical protein
MCALTEARDSLFARNRRIRGEHSSIQFELKNSMKLQVRFALTSAKGTEIIERYGTQI